MFNRKRPVSRPICPYISIKTPGHDPQAIIFIEELEAAFQEGEDVVFHTVNGNRIIVPVASLADVERAIASAVKADQ